MLPRDLAPFRLILDSCGPVPDSRGLSLDRPETCPRPVRDLSGQIHVVKYFPLSLVAP